MIYLTTYMKYTYKKFIYIYIISWPQGLLMRSVLNSYCGRMRWFDRSKGRNFPPVSGIISASIVRNWVFTDF